MKSPQVEKTRQKITFKTWPRDEIRTSKRTWTNAKHSITIYHKISSTPFNRLLSNWLNGKPNKKVDERATTLLQVLIVFISRGILVTPCHLTLHIFNSVVIYLCIFHLALYQLSGVHCASRPVQEYLYILRCVVFIDEKKTLK